MKGLLGSILLIVGLFIVCIGFAAPATTVHTGTTCYDDPMGYGQDCVRTSYESPNTSKGGLIGFGMMTSIIGGALAFSGSSESTHSQSRTDNSSGQTLTEQIQQRQQQLNHDDLE